MAERPMNFVSVGHALTWEEAAALAAGVNAFLLKESTSPRDEWIEHFADEIQAPINTYPNWVGAHRTETGWKWADGSAVAASKFAPGDVNRDADPTNDSDYAAVGTGSYLRAVTGPVSNLILQYNDTARVEGTPYDDHFSFGPFAEPGEILRMGAGDDWYSSGGGGCVDGGDGDDWISIQGSLPTTLVLDGAGRDEVFVGADFGSGPGGVIKAALDGTADTFYSVQGRISYGDTTLGVVIRGTAVTSVEAGADTAYAPHIVGGSGDDTISEVSRISGGRGDDDLAPLAFAEGGDGDDVLRAMSSATSAAIIELRGEAGNDTLVLAHAAKASGGAGVDTFVFAQAQAATIMDLSAGESVDLSALLDVSIERAFAEGYLTSVVSGRQTYLSYDSDGGGDAYALLATFKGAFPDIESYLLV